MKKREKYIGFTRPKKETWPISKKEKKKLMKELGLTEKELNSLREHIIKGEVNEVFHIPPILKNLKKISGREVEE